MESSEEYGVVVDNDEVSGADNAITVFVNCKILGDGGCVLGMVGVGLRIDYLKGLLKGYEDKFNVKAYLVDEAGDIEISTAHTGYNKINWFEHLGIENIQKEVLDWKER